MSTNHDASVNSDSESQDGQPVISNASTEATQEVATDNGAIVEEDSSPSVIKLVFIVVAVFGLLGSIAYGGWVAYQEYIGTTSSELALQQEDVSASEGVNLSGLSDGVGGERSLDASDGVVPEPNIIDEVDYQIGVVEPNNYQPDSDDKAEKVVRGITEEQYEHLISMLEANKKRMDELFNNQLLISSQFKTSSSNIENSVDDANGLLLLVKNDVDAVITGQEVLSQRLKSQTRTVKKIESTTVAEIAAKQALKEKPRFRVTDHSEWGDSVTLMIENEDGFYQSAGVGTEINGWVLRTVNLKKRASHWAGVDGSYELTW